LLDGHFSPDSFRRNMTALSPGISHEKAWSLAFDHDNRDRTGEAGRGFAVVASQLLPAALPEPLKRPITPIARPGWF
jgi:hypothetical protein